MRLSELPLQKPLFAPSDIGETANPLAASVVEEKKNFRLSELPPKESFMPGEVRRKTQEQLTFSKDNNLDLAKARKLLDIDEANNFVDGMASSGSKSGVESAFHVTDLVDKQYARYNIYEPGSMEYDLYAKGPITAREMAGRQFDQENIPFMGDLVSLKQAVNAKLALERLKKEDFDYATNPTDYTISQYGGTFGTTQTKPKFGSKEEDIKLVEDMFLKLYEAEIRGITRGGKIMQGVGVLPKYMIEFAATGGIAKFGSVAAKKAAIYMVGKAGIRSGIKGFAFKTAGVVGGGAMQGTFGFSGQTFEDVANSRFGQDVGLMERESLGKTWAKAWGNQVIEAVSERSGGLIQAPLEKLGKTALKKMPTLAKMYDGFKTVVPDGEFKDFTYSMFTKGGYNGLVAEYGEERVGTILRGLTGVDDYGLDAGNRIELVGKMLKEDFKNIGVELPILLVPGGVTQAVAGVAGMKRLGGRILDKAAEKYAENSARLLLQKTGSPVQDKAGDQAQKGTAAGVKTGTQPAQSKAVPQGGVVAYHGTTGNFAIEDIKTTDDSLVPDRLIGPHFSTDPAVASTFATNEGGNVRKVTLDIKNPRVIPQVPSENGTIPSDQWAIQVDMGRIVFPRRKDLFVKYWSKQRNMSEQEVSDIYDRLASGEYVDDPRLSPRKDKRQGDPFADLADNYGMLIFDAGMQKEFTAEYKKALAEMGYDAVQYQNTSPKETEGAKDKTAYIPLSIAQIKTEKSSSSSSAPGQAIVHPASDASQQPPTSKPSSAVEGEGEEKTRGLSLSVEARAVEAALVETLGELPKYRQLGMKEQAQRITEVAASNRQEAMLIATGQKDAPAGTYAGTWFVALETIARREGDVAMLIELATSEQAVSMATEAGRNVKAYDSFMEGISAVKAIQAVIVSRRGKAELSGKDATTESEIKELRAQLEEARKQLESGVAKKKTAERKKYGAKNVVVKESEYAAIMERRQKEADASRRGRQGGFVFVPGAQDFADLTKIVTYHAEAIGRNVAELVEKVVADMGEWVRPLLDDEFKRVFKRLDDMAVYDIEKKIRKAMAGGKDIAEMTKYAQQIADVFVRSGIVEREPLVDAVHSVMQSIDPNITRRQVMDLMSGYGQYTALDKEQAKQILRDIKGQLQQLAKLEDLQKGLPLQKTGQERRTPSDEERRLIQQVEEAKKKYGVQTTDKETQLKSALDEVKTRLRNQIKDLELQITTREKIVKERTPLELDPEAEALKAERDALRVTFDSIFGKKGLSDAQKLKMSLEAVNKSIREYGRKIHEKDFAPKAKNSIDSRELEERRQVRDALKALYEDMKDLASPKLTAQELALRKLKRGLESRTAKLESMFESGEFGKPEKIATILDEEAIELRKKWEAARDKLKAAMEAYTGITEEEVAQIAALSKAVEDTRQKMEASPRRDRPGKATDTELAHGLAQVMFQKYVNSLKAKKAISEYLAEYLKNPLKPITDLMGAVRSVVASLDNSFIGRQGIKLFFRGVFDPEAAKMWGQTFLESYKAMWGTLKGENVEDGLMAMILSDPEYALIKRTKVDIATIEEEIPISLGKIPILGLPFGISEKAYLVSAHYMRYRIAKMYLSIWRNAGRDMNDNKELEDIGKLVGSMTMRGKTGSVSTEGLNVVNNLFFSPRGLKGDFDFLTMHLFDSKMSWYAKRQAAENMLRYIAGAGAILLISDFMDDDTVTWDPRSTDFGKIKIGNTRFTVGGSIPVMVVLASRLISGATVNSITGKKNELNSGKFGAITKTDLIYNFLENKFAPGVSVAKALLDGRNRDGTEPTAGNILYQLGTPLQIQTFLETATVEDAANLLTVMIAEAHGIGSQSYDGSSFKQKSKVTPGW